MKHTISTKGGGKIYPSCLWTAGKPLRRNKEEIRPLDPQSDPVNLEIGRGKVKLPDPVVIRSICVTLDWIDLPFPFPECSAAPEDPENDMF